MDMEFAEVITLGGTYDEAAEAAEFMNMEELLMELGEDDDEVEYEESDSEE